MKNAILFSNGEYKDEEFYKELLIENDFYIVAIDGGLNFLNRIGFIPDLIIGDFDSVDPGLLEFYVTPEKIKFESKKDKTDTELAIDEVVKRGYKEIMIAGLFGNRVDHSLANLLLLKHYAEENIPITYISEVERIVCFQGPKDILLFANPGTTISLLPLSEEVTGVTISGFEYPLDDATLSVKSPSLGVSNIVTQEMQTVSFESGVLMIVFNTKK